MQENIYSHLKSIASKSAGGKVFILGKGPSLDEVQCTKLPPGIVINLNDSESIHPGDIGVFSSNWVRHSLQELNFGCGFYLAGKPLPPNVPHEVLHPVPMELDHEDFNLLRLQREEFFDESFILLTALKVCLRLAHLIDRKLEVFLLGLDFSTSAGLLSAKVGTDFSGAGPGEREVVVAAQESSFRQIYRFMESHPALLLNHVGTKEYSAYSPAGFNRRFCTAPASSPRKLIDFSDPERVLIVAEFTNNHLGDPGRLVEMVERAKDCGADLVKVQKRDVDSFYSPEQLQSPYWSPFGNTLGDYRRGVELDDGMLSLLDETCLKCEIEWFCSVLDMPSYQAVAKYRPPIVKVPSTISNHRSFHHELADVYTGPIVVSTGFTGPEYIDYVLKTFARNEILYLLHCISAYPAPRSACNVAVVRSYESLHRLDRRIIPGYSSHDIGSLGSVMAIAAGARMLEKHVKLGDAEWVHFDRVALDLATHDFRNFVRDVRSSEEVVGSEEKRILECEHHKYAVREKAGI